MACYSGHRFGDAARILEAARQVAIADENPQEAASYSGLLASCLTLMNRNEDALLASEEAERLAHVERLGPSDPWRLRALSLLGQARLALGDSDAAVASFKEIAASAYMDRLRRAEYAGVYDLGLVSALRRGLAPVECRNYLSLLAQIESHP